MMTAVILLLVYLSGTNICFWMLQTEHKAEGNILTKGDVVTCFLLSLLSWLAVLWCLTSTWVEKIRVTGYWDQPVNKDQKQQSENKLKKAG